ncbi:MAG: hypothetical protein OER88_10265, partial [Planctomycetota bacterium]|nr:hypothetical protein [Planctomycetota bacterium]
MRRWPLLLIATAVFAEPDQVQSDLKRLEHARARIKQPGAHAAVYEAVDRLVKGADARAVSPLADLLVETYALEDTIEVQQRDLELEGAGAKEEIGVIRRELDFLRKKALAGDRSAARKIEEREERIRERDRMFDRVSDRVARLERLRRFAKDLRKRVATGLGAICAAQEDKAADAAFRDLRRVLDVADDAQSLELVGVLKESGRVEAIPHLEAISKHPKA